MSDGAALRFQRSTEVLSRAAGSSVLVTTPDDDDVHELSGGATAVWDALRVPTTAAELVDRLAAAHGVPRPEIAGQVEECLTMLLALGVAEEMRGVDG